MSRGATFSVEKPAYESYNGQRNSAEPTAMVSFSPTTQTTGLAQPTTNGTTLPSISSKIGKRKLKLIPERIKSKRRMAFPKTKEEDKLKLIEPEEAISEDHGTGSITEDKLNYELFEPQAKKKKENKQKGTRKRPNVGAHPGTQKVVHIEKPALKQPTMESQTESGNLVTTHIDDFQVVDGANSDGIPPSSISKFMTKSSEDESIEFSAKFNPDESLIINKNIMIAMDREQQRIRKLNQARQKLGASPAANSSSESTPNSELQQKEYKHSGYPLQQLFKSLIELTEEETERLLSEEEARKQVRNHEKKHEDSVSATKELLCEKKDDLVQLMECKADAVTEVSVVTSPQSESNGDAYKPVYVAPTNIEEQQERSKVGEKSSAALQGEDEEDLDNVQIPMATEQADTVTQASIGTPNEHAYEPLVTTSIDEVDDDYTSLQHEIPPYEKIDLVPTLSSPPPPLTPPSPPPPLTPSSPPATHIDSNKPLEQAVYLGIVDDDKQPLIAEQTEKNKEANNEVFDKKTKEAYREVYKSLLKDSEYATDKCCKCCAKTCCLSFTCTPSCVCRLIGRQGEMAELLKITTDALQKGSTGGWKMFGDIVTPLLHSIVRDIIAATEFAVRLVAFILSAVSFGLGSNAAYNALHLVLSIISLVLAIIDCIFSIRSFGACKLFLSRRRKQADSESQNNDCSEATKHTNVPQKNAADKRQIEKSDDSDKMAIPAFLRRFWDISWIVVAELVLYPLLICDLIELIVGKSYRFGTADDRVNFILFVLSIASLFLTFMSYGWLYWPYLFTT